MSSHSEFVVPLMRGLRAEILAAYGKISHELKDDMTVVTEIDKAIETKLMVALSAEYPDIGFLGEEHGQSGSTDRYWLIDPIDGTESYIRGLPGVTSMLGLVENNECSQSYIYDPVHDKMFTSFKGGGAYCDDVQIKIENRPKARAIVAYSTGVSKHKPEFIRKLYDSGVFYATQYFGSGYKATLLASGKIDAVITYNKPGEGGGLWDYVPTRLLMQEAGARFMDFEGRGLESRFYTMSSDTLQDDLTRLVRENLT